MKTVLIPVDFSEGSLNSCKYTVRIARKDIPVNIWLFHIYADQFMYQPVTDPEGFLTDPVFLMEFVDELKKIANENLEKLKNELYDFIKEEGYTNFTVKTLLIQGDPQWMIEDVCEDLSPDAIVMASEGAGKKDFLEGSMSLKIMGRAPVPVVAVPADYQEEKLKYVMYATKLENDESDLKNIRLIFNLFAHLNISIFATHFRQDTEEGKSFEFLEKAFEKERLKGKIRFLVVNTSDTEVSIKTTVHENKINMIAFTAHKTSPLKLLFSKGIHKDDFFAAGVPVLGFPEKT